MIKTDRLILRPWQDGDLNPFAAMNADPRVREYFFKTLTTEESNTSVNHFKEHLEKYGWGFWAASLLQTNEFIGFIGLQHVTFDAPFTPAVEIGWRLAYPYWGKGYATEGAKAVIKFGFDDLNLPEIVAFTPLQNTRSQNVMKKIGMSHDPKDNFDHPFAPNNHPLERHVLYRI